MLRVNGAADGMAGSVPLGFGDIDLETSEGRAGHGALAVLPTHSQHLEKD